MADTLDMSGPSSPEQQRANRILSEPLRRSLKRSHPCSLSEYLNNTNRLAHHHSSSSSTDIRGFLHPTAAQHRPNQPRQPKPHRAPSSNIDLWDSPSGLHLAHAAELLMRAGALTLTPTPKDQGPLGGLGAGEAGGDVEEVEGGSRVEGDSMGCVTDFLPLLGCSWFSLNPGLFALTAGGGGFLTGGGGSMGMAGIGEGVERLRGESSSPGGGGGAGRRKRKRCGECVPCRRMGNCEECSACRNRKTGHQICKYRKCEQLKKKAATGLEKMVFPSGAAFPWLQ
ncbi:CXXC-type zinc finger protein 5-like [Salmo trutta]|uniref:CXXC-type zinc finger protein 5-like n=1 Tax=Salmo trutta TaxID=8032 RepID=UPI001131C93D|nr:CXXC-type zinc finger protein 5-like [Salmo trutta]XP_029627545.1 CXXC-type zinc finger protein 5-like [Salmo trutta]XP_029627546.1 CXXC-type zinc finger protein 5-like [Salmo trutta]